MNLISNKDLYDLIKSMSKSEKRFLKLSAFSIKLSSELITFFDLIDREKEFTSEFFKTKTNSKELYEFILKILRSLYADSSSSFLIKDEITNIFNLFDKAQYKQCRKTLNKQKKESYLYERFHFVLELIEFEKMLIKIETQFNTSQITLENLIIEEEEVIRKAKNLGEYTVLYSKLNLDTRQKNKAKTDEDLTAIKSFLESPLLKSKAVILSNKALVIYHHCRSILFCRCQDNESREKECNLLIQLMDSQPTLIEEMPNRYITTLNNLINIAFEERRFKTCLLRINELQKVSTYKAFNTADLQLKIIISTLNAQLVIHTNTGNFKEGEKTIIEIVKLLKTFNEKINKEDEIVFNYNISIFYTYNNNHKTAQLYISKVLKQGNKLLREDLQSFAKIINIGLNYEIGNLNQLNYIILAIKQNKINQISHFKTEDLMLVYFDKLTLITKSKKKESERIIFESFKKDLEKVMKNPHENNVNYYFEIEAFINSKLTGKSMNELIAEKYKKASLI